MHRSWEQPAKFQNEISDLGYVFSQEFTKNGRDRILEQVAFEWRAKRGEPLKCKTLLDQKHIEIGRRNVVFRVQFVDGPIWVARLRNPLANRSILPDNRAIEMRSMESEVTTMEYVKRHTTIPIPTLFGYDCTYSNPLGCPYLLMEHIDGKPLPDVVDELGGMTDGQIFKIHAQLANVSLQLSRLCFPTIGHLYRDRTTNEVVVGGIVDRKGRELDTFDSASEFYTRRALLIYHETQRIFASNANNIDPKLRELETAYLHTLATPFAVTPEFDKGPFPLQHVDLHRQNVLADDDWNVVGIIDWSWAGTAPLDSFRPLPFNLAKYILPYDPDNVERHEKLFWRHMENLEGAEVDLKGFKLTSLRFRASAKIASILDWYSYPDRRIDDVEELLKHLPPAYTQAWNEGLKEGVLFGTGHH